jgi:hypothetical protein
MEVSSRYLDQAETMPRLQRVQAAQGGSTLPDIPAGEPAPLQLLIRLVTEANRRGLNYCYWRSGRRVYAAMAGDSDLDLLVDRQDREHAQQILLACGFKQFASVSSRDHPAISDFLGYDEPSGRIVHVHMHLRLVVGESLLKNYRVPWEKRILTAAVPHSVLPLRVLDPISEAVLLVVRAAVELRRLDPVVLRRWGAVSDKFAADRRILTASLDRDTLRAGAARMTGEAFAELLAEALYAERPLERQGRTMRGIRRALADHRSYNAFEARLRGVGRAVCWVAGALNKRVLHFPRPWSRRIPGGGVVVALLGVDGSGKTTVTAAIREWLGAEVDILPIYFGTGDGRPTLLLLPFKFMTRLLRPMLRRKLKGSSHGEVADRPPGLLYGALLTVWATVLAVEKRLKLHSARRAASRGMAVIGDRYPQNELPSFNDGPLLPRLPRVPRWLRRFEAGAYALSSRLPPDLVIRLVATPEVLAVREPNMQPTVIRERVSQLLNLGFPGARVVNVNAELPLSEVIRVVKQEIWGLL